MIESIELFEERGGNQVPSLLALGGGGEELSNGRKPFVGPLIYVIFSVILTSTLLFLSVSPSMEEYFTQYNRKEEVASFLPRGTFSEQSIEKASSSMVVITDSHRVISGVISGPSHVISSSKISELDQSKLSAIDRDGNVNPLTVKSSDENSGISVLYSESNFYSSSVEWVDSSTVQEGGEVFSLYASGKSFNLLFSKGSVSDSDRTMRFGKSKDPNRGMVVDRSIQGKPEVEMLFDRSGRFVGMSTEETGEKFAHVIPGNYLRNFSESSLRGKTVENREIGLEVSDSISMGFNSGARVESVPKDLKGKLSEGDIIVGFNGMNVVNSEDFLASERSTPKGAPISLKVKREDELLDVKI